MILVAVANIQVMLHLAGSSIFQCRCHCSRSCTSLVYFNSLWCMPLGDVFMASNSGTVSEIGMAGNANGADFLLHMACLLVIGYWGMKC